MLEYYSVMDESWHALVFGKRQHSAIGAYNGKIWNRYLRKGFIRNNRAGPFSPFKDYEHFYKAAFEAYLAKQSEKGR